MRRSAGRKRKPGKRTPSGRLVRLPRIDKGAPGVVRRQAAYGVYAAANDGGRVLVDTSQTFDALGRAWSAGLLGEPERATRYRDSGRIIAAQYWRVYGFATPDSLARFQPTHGFGIPDPEKDAIREQALNDALDMVRGVGRDVSRAFEQLVIEINPDCGPAWLDRIIIARRRGVAAMERDTVLLDLALRGLAVVA